MKTLMEYLKTDILIEKNNQFISPIAANRIIDYIDNFYIPEERKQMYELIRFMRSNDKMGKSVDDLYNEFYENF
jgi:hypothetical protein